MDAGQARFRRRGKPGEVVQADELPPTFEQLRRAGHITESDYVELSAMQAHFRSLPLAARRRGITLTEFRRLPIRRGHVGAPCRRPAGRKVTTGARGGDSGDPDEPPPALAGPSRPWRDVDEAVAERRRALDALSGGKP